MLRVIVLLEGESPSQSQISGRLKQVSLKNVLFIYIIFSINHHSFNFDQFPSHRAYEKHPHMMLPPPCFTVRMGFSG
jgi:hypothetical protein